jgi:O-antigen ligase/tetratricopeptide (TPR) repeat protein
MQIDNTLKYIIYTLLGLVFLVPFVVDSSQLFPFITGKAFYFRILAESIFFVWLILAIRKPEYRPRLSLIMISITAFVVFIGLANVFGANPFNSFWSNYERMEGYINILHLFAMFLAIGSVVKTKEDWNKIILASLIISLGILYVAFQQYFGAKAISQGGDRLDATFGNPIYLSVYSLFHIFFGLYLISAKDFLKNHGYKITIGGITLLHLFVLYHTNTRGAVVGLVAGLFSTAFLNIFNAKKENRKIWLTSIVSVALIISGILGFILIKDSDFVRNNKVLNRFAEISLTSGTSEARLLNWGIAFEGFQERPVLGWGMGNYNYVFDKYYKPAMYGNESWFDHVHNVVLDWLIAGGIIGLFLFLLILLSLVWTIWRNKEYSHTERNIFIGLVVGYFIQNLFVFDNQTSYIYLFLLLAMFHALKNKEISIFKSKLNDNVIYASSIIILVLLPVTIYAVNASGYFASRNVITTLRDLSAIKQAPQSQVSNLVKKIVENIKETVSLNSPASFEVRTKGVVEPSFTLIQLPTQYFSDQEKQDYVRFALSDFTNEIKNDPQNSKTSYIMAVYLGNFGDYQNAVNFYEKAIELSPNKQVLQIASAFNYLKLGQKEKAIEVAKNAYELAEGDSEINPKYDNLWIDYMRVVASADLELFNKLIIEEIKEGRPYRVEALLKKVIELSPDKYQSYVSLAAFYFNQDETPKSLEVLKMAKDKFPEIESKISKLISDLEAGKDVLGNKY